MIFIAASFGIALALAADATEQPQPIYRHEARTPPDICFGQPNARLATFIFSVQKDGSTSDFIVNKSSSNRACDRAAIDAIKRWRYAPRSSSITVVESVAVCVCSASSD